MHSGDERLIRSASEWKFEKRGGKSYSCSTQSEHKNKFSEIKD